MSNQATFAAALRDADAGLPGGLHVWNGSDAAVRFAVHRNNVVVSLVDALADTFAVTQALVGEEFFRAMARVYLQTQPVTPRVLTWLGEPFADFIEAFAPTQSLPYLADVARLEMLRVHAYHAADVLPMTLPALAQVLADPAGLADAKIRLMPGVQVLASRYAVYSLWAAHQGALAIEAVNPALAQTVLVFRRALDVELLLLSAAQGRFIARLLAGDKPAQAVAAAGPEAGLDTDFDLAATLALLMQRQLIHHLQTGDLPL